MKVNLVKRNYFILFYVFFIFIVFTILYENKNSSIQEHLHSATKKIYLDYMVIYNSQKDLADLVFQAEINSQEIISLFKARDREKLYDYLKEDYAEYRKFNIRQLHFHLPNNDSFLRMHRPNKYGDNLSKARLTVKYVNENRKFIDGFEEGKIFNGFRFVYPLFDKEEHIGSVEISFSALTFIKNFIKNYDIKANFQIDKAIVDAKVFKDERSNYIQSPLKNYYFQKSISEYLKLNYSAVKFSKEELEEINLKIKQGEPFSIYRQEANRVITFVPLRNPITSQVVGTMNFREGDEVIQRINQNTLIVFIGFVVVAGLLLILLYRELKYEQKLEHEVEDRTRELSLLNDKLKNLASVDALTGVHNRRYLYEISAKLISLMRRGKSAMSVAMLDIDKFKEINDTYGHDAGDKVLQNMTTLIKSTIRESDIFVRYGGEEFVLLLPNTTLSQALISMEKIRYTVESSQIFSERTITISIGVVEFKDDIDQSIKKADEMMYKAKVTGRNRVCSPESCLE